MVRAIGIGLAVIVAVLGIYYVGILQGWYGQHRGPGEIKGEEIPATIVEERQADQTSAARSMSVTQPKQIMFGDLHVHTTFSTDAFLWALPINGGEGAYPLADACDYARYCSSLDFWSINDHAEASTPRRWQETKDSIRQCNAVSGNANDQDVISLIGFEWTQVSAFPEQHYGHKNVIFRGLDDDQVTARPIASTGVATDVIRGSAGILPPQVALIDLPNRQNYYDFRTFMEEAREIPACDPNVSSADLPPDCFEAVATPADLVRKLDEQGLTDDAIIIPHGTSWGFYTPPSTTLDKQLQAEMNPERQPLIEIMSGHGNSEEYRPWRAAIDNGDGTFTCPSPTEGYLPSCWRAGEIIRERCETEGETQEVCDQRAIEARELSVNLGVAGHLAVSGETPEEWLDAGQCKDCFQPPFNHRPGTSVQYGLAITNFDDPGNPRNFKWGFLASSDNHRARPGTGYKEFDRTRTTESNGPISKTLHDRQFGDRGEPTAKALEFSREELLSGASFQMAEVERQNTFWNSGGLAAVHATARNRDALWEAFERREIYGTSGPRILLWFDHVATDGRIDPMGSELTQNSNPTFRVRAVGSFKQQPGCPEFSAAGLGQERLDHLCAGECYNPSDERHLISRIEIIRVRPQVSPDENVDGLIEDAWKTFDCPQDIRGCTFEFSDPEFEANGRNTLYYARAVQEPTEAINAKNLRCEYDADGNCVKVNMCYGDYRTAKDDDCLSQTEERAWSSPIYVNYPG